MKIEREDLENRQVGITVELEDDRLARAMRVTTWSGFHTAAVWLARGSEVQARCWSLALHAQSVWRPC